MADDFGVPPRARLRAREFGFLPSFLLLKSEIDDPVSTTVLLLPWVPRMSKLNSILQWANDVLERPERLTWENWLALGLLAGAFCLYCLRSKPYN